MADKENVAAASSEALSTALDENKQLKKLNDELQLRLSSLAVKVRYAHGDFNTFEVPWEELKKQEGVVPLLQKALEQQEQAAVRTRGRLAELAAPAGWRQQQQPPELVTPELVTPQQPAAEGGTLSLIHI